MTMRRPAAAAAVLAAVLITATVAQASNRRVSLSNYQWSEPTVRIDRGEHVTWHWIGPDTMHSITGTSPNDAGIDSDPNNDQPRHLVGDSFRVDFDQPGTYTFQCKLHSLVRGTVVVSSKQGDPNTEVDPVPASNVDLQAPHMSGFELRDRGFRRGTNLRIGVDESSKVEAEFFRSGRRVRDLPRFRRYVGFQRWRVHVGYNDVPFVRKAQHFRARPGRYMALLRATDHSNNESPAKRIRFRIR